MGTTTKERQAGWISRRWALPLAGVLALSAVGLAAWRIGALRATPSGAADPRTPIQLILALERTAAADPDPRPAYEGLGAACLRMGHLLSAREAFRHVRRLGGDSAWLGQQLAWCALRLDRQEEALREYRGLIERDGRGADRAGYLRLAAAALRMGDTETARSALAEIPAAARSALLEPRSAEERIQLARYLSLMEAVAPPAETERVARQAVARMPEEPAGYAASARLALRRGRSREALPLLQKAFSLAPDRPDLHALRGDALLALGDPRERDAARQAYRRAVTLSPALGPAWYRLAGLALEDRDWEEAARAFAAARSLGTEPVESLRGMARAAEGAGQARVAAQLQAEYHEERGEIEAARRLYQRLLENPETELAATLRLADLDARHQQRRDALARLEAASRRAPASVEVWQALARVYRALGRLPEAQSAWRRVAALDAAAAPEAHRALAILAESLGEFDAAEQEYLEAVRRDPGDAATRRYLGTLLFTRRRLGDRLPRAVAELERAVALDPADSSGFAALGHAYEAAGRPEEALLALRHAIDLAPGSGALYLEVSRLARRLGKAEEGQEMLALYRRYRQAQRQLESLRSTVAARPNDPQVRLALADYYFAARDFSRAATEYERVLALGERSLAPAARRAVREQLALAYERLARREEAATQLTLLEQEP